jgi:hypothetical protein
MLEKSKELDLFRLKELSRIRQQRYYQKNKERIKKYSRDYIKRDPERRKFQLKRSLIKKRYGIVYEDYLSMHHEQEYKCKICKRHANEFKKGLVVDHDHKSGKVRALLCTNCNSQLHVLENKELYDKYMNYLNIYKEE